MIKPFKGRVDVSIAVIGKDKPEMVVVEFECEDESIDMIVSPASAARMGQSLMEAGNAALAIQASLAWAKNEFDLSDDNEWMEDAVRKIGLGIKFQREGENADID